MKTFTLFKTLDLRIFKIKFTGWWLALLLVLPQLSACSTYRSADPQYGSKNYGVVTHGSYKVAGKRYYVASTATGYDKTGYASWYGGRRFLGRRTSSHETYNMYAMTAASRDLPIPSYVQVTNLRNGRSVVVKINDRGPFRASRIIDLSYAAAQQLGFTRSGTTMVRVTGIHVEPLASGGNPAKITQLLAQNGYQKPISVE